jgi:hypothetical protein
MSNKTVNFLIIALSLVPCASAWCGENSKQPKLEMKVSSIDLEDAKFGNRKEVSVHVEIRNVGTVAALIPTKGIGPASVGNAGYRDLFFQDVQVTTKDGFRFAYAPSDLAIVELRPGEAILLGHTFPKPPPGSVRVRYMISKEFAERYGTWSGELDGGLIQLSP